MYASPVLFSCCIYYDRCESMAVDAFTIVLVMYCACILSVLHVHIYRKVSVTRNLTFGTGIKVDCWCLRNRYGATSTQTLNKFIVFYTVSLLVRNFLLSFLLVICGFTFYFNISNFLNSPFLITGWTTSMRILCWILCFVFLRCHTNLFFSFWLFISSGVSAMKNSVYCILFN